MDINSDLRGISDDTFDRIEACRLRRGLDVGDQEFVAAVSRWFGGDLYQSWLDWHADGES